MLCQGGYPLFPTSNQTTIRCPDCGRWYDKALEDCPYCAEEDEGEYDTPVSRYWEVLWTWHAIQVMTYDVTNRRIAPCYFCRN